jgi:hypothetical protein
MVGDFGWPIKGHRGVRAIACYLIAEMLEQEADEL